MRLLALLSLLLCGSALAKDIAGPRDQFGTSFKLSDWSEDRLVVVAFVGVECPLAQLYSNRLVELHGRFAPQGVAFVAVDSNQQDAADEIAAFARRFPFPMLHDADGSIARQFAATRTPQVFLLNAARDVIYSGRIDDQYAPGIHSRTSPERRDLEVAITEALAFKPVSVPVTEPVGCLIDQPLAEHEGPTYSGQIAAIFDSRCVACHRPGEAAPFSLATYDDTRGWSEMIAEVVSERRMPPWGAEGGHFANDRSLSDAEREQILAWVAAGSPAGDPAERPAPPVFPEGWSIAPDRIFAASEFTVGAEGVLDYQEFVIEPGFSDDAWVDAIEVRPSNRSVVHHATLLVKPPGAPRGMFFFDEMFDNYLALYVPGNSVTSFPPGFAKRIPAGWNLVLQVHYVPTGTQQVDQTRVGLSFARSPQVQVATRMAEKPIDLAPGEIKTGVAEFALDDDYVLVALYPHMHLRGRSMLFEAIFPDGRREPLLDVPDYDFEWQHRYVLEQPQAMPKGTRLRCTAVFDNSAANPRNPDPTAFVQYGEATTDEMFFGAFELGRPIREDKERYLLFGWSGIVLGASYIAARRFGAGTKYAVHAKG